MQTNTQNNADEPAFPYGQVSELTGRPINGFFNAGLTARQYAAIHLRVPQSGDEWLDDMITEARRWDVAQAALVGSFSAKGPKENSAYEARQQAYALTRQMKGGTL